MFKKCLVMVMVVSMLICSNAFAATRFDDMNHKLGRGLTNLITGPMELGKEIDTSVETSGWYKGLVFGTLKGLYKAIARSSAGIYEVITFAIEAPEDFKPIIEPEFVFAKDCE